MHTQHFIMLQRNLLYTAVTRAQKLMIIVGDPKALDIALGNLRQMDRNTGLAERIRTAIDS
jgi:exodeoxyribonuclease V alpha subunit